MSAMAAERIKCLLSHNLGVRKKCFITVITPSDKSGLAHAGRTVCRIVDIRAGLWSPLMTLAHWSTEKA